MAAIKFYGRSHVKFSKQIKAIIFDLDNTLINTRRADVKTVNKVTYE
jgi:predicted HAD superfamily phosphohydrolase YqeG